MLAVEQFSPPSLVDGEEESKNGMTVRSLQRERFQQNPIHILLQMNAFSCLCKNGSTLATFVATDCNVLLLLD